MSNIRQTIVQASLAALVAAGMSLPAMAADGRQLAQRADAPSARSGISAERLIGSSIYDTAGAKVGEIESVLLDRSGKAQAVVVGVGGFLGIGKREVAIGWENLNPGETGYRMTTTLSKEELKALPEYRFRSEKDRRTAFNDPDYRASAAGRRDGGAPVTTAPDRTGDMAADRSADRGDVRTKGWSKAVGPQGEIRASSFIGTPVMNALNEKIGEVDEVLIGKDGEISAVVSVGGFLGMGERHVQFPWNRLALDTKGKDVRVSVDASKEQLEKMPAYRKD